MRRVAEEPSRDSRAGEAPVRGAIGVVVNPFAGGNRVENRRTEELRRLVAKDGVVCEPGSLAEIDAAIIELRDRGVDVLAICGGDGSFFRTLTAMVRLYGEAPLPRFLPLRAGSMNTIARAVGCRRGTPEAVLQAVLDDRRNGRPADTVCHRLIRVNGDRYGFLVGAGLIVNFLQAYYDRPQRGPMAAAHLLARVAFGGAVRSAEVARLFETAPASVTCDGVDLGHRPYRIIFASTVAEIGLGFRFAYRAVAGAAGFHFLAGSLAPGQVLVRLPGVRRGKPLRVQGWHDSLGHEVEVEFDEPSRYMIDGDVLEAVSRLELSLGPELTIIRK